MEINDLVDRYDVNNIEIEDFDREEVLRRKSVLHKSLFTKKEYLMQKARERLPDKMVDGLYTLYHRLATIK
jgi:hypothetical protein